MVYYIIPDLSYMEPFEGANQKLLEHTLDSIQKKFHKRVIVATDRGKALDFVKDMRVKGMPVSESIVENRGSYKDVLLDIGSKMHMDDDDDFVMLSLEYPGRTYRNIRSAIQHYRKHGSAKSLLCKRSVDEHPYKMFIEKDNGRGEPAFSEFGQEWRRGEFPDMFKHSHFVSIHQVSELENVNDWLWNEDTVFFPIDVDIDRVRTQKQLDSFENDE
jgi:CMP-N-acetylneuraminic acid synthetase